MIAPKGKISKARRNSRKANWKISTPSISECPHCHEAVESHKVCRNCGYYNGKEVMKVEENA